MKNLDITYLRQCNTTRTHPLQTTGPLPSTSGGWLGPRRAPGRCKDGERRDGEGHDDADGDADEEKQKQKERRNSSVVVELTEGQKKSSRTGRCGKGYGA